MAEFSKPPCKDKGHRMRIEKVFQGYETRFWKVVTPMMGDKGILMKIVQFFQNILKSRVGYLNFIRYYLGSSWVSIRDDAGSGNLLGAIFLILIIEFFNGLATIHLKITKKDCA